jgi:hypothetical protein
VRPQRLPTGSIPVFANKRPGQDKSTSARDADVGPRPVAYALCRRALPRPQLADLRRFVLRSFVAKQAITTIFVVEPTNDGWSVRIGDERVGSFSTHRQALDDVKNRRATLTAKGQRSTVVVTRHGSDPT